LLLSRCWLGPADAKLAYAQAIDRGKLTKM
jgi:hypothetical protein